MTGKGRCPSSGATQEAPRQAFVPAGTSKHMPNGASSQCAADEPAAMNKHASMSRQTLGGEERQTGDGAGDGAGE